MRLVRDPATVGTLPPGAMREVIRRAIDQLGSDSSYDPEIDGVFVIVEPGEGIAFVERMTGCRLTGSMPGWELVERHSGGDLPGCFEILFLLGDAGYGIVVLIPDREDIDPELLAWCRARASPSSLLT